MVIPFQILPRCWLVGTDVYQGIPEVKPHLTLDSWILLICVEGSGSRYWVVVDLSGSVQTPVVSIFQSVTSKRSEGTLSVQRNKWVAITADLEWTKLQGN
jgi:hypothetical protein